MKRIALIKHLRKFGCVLNARDAAIRYGSIRRQAKVKLSLVIPRFPISSRARSAAGCRYRKLARNRERLSTGDLVITPEHAVPGEGENR